jgi:flagellar basal-body rod modification protein FlgD
MAVDPIGNTNTNAQSSNALKTLGGDYENFLKLLTVQLQNQDPTNPTDTTQLTQQIAMLSQVEQQINTNKNLEKLIDLTNATQFNNVVGYIGKRIEAPGSAGYLQNNRAEFVYYLDGDPAQAAIKIKDEGGNVVYSGSGPVAHGRNEFAWNGVGSTGAPMPNGVYSIEVEAKDANGNTVSSQTYTTGIVTAVDSANGQVYLSIGELSVPIGVVTSIRQVNNNSNSQS